MMEATEKNEPPRLFKISHQILSITGINFESKSFVGYVELTIWPAVPDLSEIRINSRQSSIFRINIDKKYDAEFTYFDPTLSIGQNNPIKRNIEYFHKHNRNCLNSVSAESGNGELIIKLPEAIMPTVSALGSFTVCVEFSVQQPQGGVHFVVPDMPGTMAQRSAHMFTYAVENFSRMWFPCMDSFFDPCTWKIEVTVDRSMTAVSCGDLVSVEYNEEMTEKTYHYFLSSPVAAPNIALAVGPFEILVDPKMHEVTHFCLPGLMPVLKHTTSYIHQAFEFYEELMSSRYPYSYYKQVFVDTAYSEVATYSTMSILSTNLLHPANIIDQTVTSRQLMATAVAQQFFGSFIAMEKWSDAWLTKGICGYLSYLFSKRTFGNNEYRNMVMKDLQEVCQYEREVGPIILDPSKMRESASPHPFGLGCPHTLSPRYTEVMTQKARLVVRMLETRIGTELLLQVLNKLLSLAYNASQAQFGFSSWANMVLSTSSFLKIIYTVTGKDVEPFIEQWVRQGGCARFTGNFVFNRKRNVVELEIKQDLTAAGALKFAGTLNVTIQELDGSFNHQFKIEENKTKFEITCHSKSRRNKKKKIPLMTGEEVDMDLSAMDADSPVLWLRLDPDLQLIRTVHFEQPDYMWQYQLKYERCIVAQFEAIQALKGFPTPASRYALNDTIENEECYHKVRQEACYCLAKVANQMAGTWTGPPAMITIFRKMFGSHSCPVIIRQNNFSNFHHYYLLKTMPQAMACLRDTHNLCLTEITKFLLDLFKYNDNSRNKWSDNYYRSALISALAVTITPAITNVSLITGQQVTADSLSSDTKLLVEEVVRCLNLEKLMPSYRFTVTVSCLHCIRTLQKFGHLPNESEVFHDYAQPGIFRDVRVAAITCLVDFIKGDFTGEHLKWILDLIENDADPFLRHHAVRSLVENPPFRSSERSALNVEALVERLWAMLCKTTHDVRLRCGLADLYYTLYGRHRPSCLPQPETVKLAQAEKKASQETIKEEEAVKVPDPDLVSMSSTTTSSMWNQELTSIFEPDPPDIAEPEEVEVPPAVEETVEVEIRQSEEVDMDMTEENKAPTPVDLTMISGETTVAMEESVVTEEAPPDPEVKSEPAVEVMDEEIKMEEGKEDEEAEEKEKIRELSLSHLSEDSLSPGHSPSKGTEEDEIISLDNVINSHAEVPAGEMFEASPKKEMSESPSSQRRDSLQLSPPNTSERKSSVDGGDVSIKPAPAVMEEREDTVRSPVRSLPPRRRSLRSASQLSSASVSPAAGGSGRQRSPASVSPAAGGSGRQRSPASVSPAAGGSGRQRSPASVSPAAGGSGRQRSPASEESKPARRLSLSPVRLSDHSLDADDHDQGAVTEIILDQADTSSPRTSPSPDLIRTPHTPPQDIAPTTVGSDTAVSVGSPPTSPTMASQGRRPFPLPQQYPPHSPPHPPSPQAESRKSPTPERPPQESDNPRNPSPCVSPHHHQPSEDPDPEAASTPPPPDLSYQEPASPADHSLSPGPSEPALLSPPHPLLQRETDAQEEEASPPPTLQHTETERQAEVEPPPHSLQHSETEIDKGVTSPPHPLQYMETDTQEEVAAPPLTEVHSPPPPVSEGLVPPLTEVHSPPPPVSEGLVPPLKRKLSLPAEPSEVKDEPEEPKRLVPPIKLSSSALQPVGGTSSQPSLKFKLGAAVAASEAKEREHHHHHKSKKKKKKNKHKHKHKHRREDRGDDPVSGEATSEGQPRPRLLLDMSARSRMVVDEDDGSSD